MSLAARDLIFWILNINILIQTPVKTEFAKPMYKVDFKVGDDYTPHLDYLLPFIRVKINPLHLILKIVKLVTCVSYQSYDPPIFFWHERLAFQSVGVRAVDYV